jgi:exopolyphosphatase / guanosine-5'-triphosphate,3'-diphosphate pyrophosphatase
VTPVAAVDCGTNSIRLLIAEPNGTGGLVDLERRTEIVRLGQGVDATGAFHPDALARTFTAVEEYAKLIRQAQVPVDRIHFVATSATRDVRNREEFFAGVRERLGVTPDVITGDQEAQLSFTGALSRVRPEGEPALVMDIGGGSTEFIVGSAAGEMSFAISLDIGSVRVTERFLKSSPPTANELAAAAAYVDGLLESSAVDFASVGTWIGVAGTATTLAGVYLELAKLARGTTPLNPRGATPHGNDRERVHGASIPLADLAALLRRLSTMTADEIRALPSMHPGRADVITGGTLIASRVAVHVPVPDMIVSESDILDGIALELLAAAH